MDDETDYLDWRQGCYICESHIRPASDQYPGVCWCWLLEPYGERAVEPATYAPPWQDDFELAKLLALKAKVMQGKLSDMCSRGHAGCTTCEASS